MEAALSRPVRVLLVVGAAHVDGVRALWRHCEREVICSCFPCTVSRVIRVITSLKVSE